MSELLDHAIATVHRPEIVQDAVTPMSLLQVAMSQNADLDKLTKLMELQERWDANAARNAFNDSLAKFKENPPKILKNRHVEFETARGTTKYDHATLDHVCEQITKGLAEVGIAHKWRLSQEEKRISVTCILTHRMGHSEETTLTAMPDDSGGKNAIQQIGSTVSYLERYTLMAATGTASGMQDDDGRGTVVTAKKDMPLDRFAHNMERIEGANDLKELQTAYKDAYKEADTYRDEKARDQFIAAKDARKEALECE